MCPPDNGQLNAKRKVADVEIPGQTSIETLDGEGARSCANIECWMQGRECYVRISCGEESSGASAPDFFAAFGLARKPLEARGYRFVCYGASKDVWPSGMARDVGLGLKAYRIAIGEKAGPLVSIFESGEDVVVCAAEEQEAFVWEWLDQSA